MRKCWIRASTTSENVLLWQRDEIVHDSSPTTRHLLLSSTTKNKPFACGIIRSNDCLAKITGGDDGTRKVERRNDAVMVEKASAMTGVEVYLGQPVY